MMPFRRGKASRRPAPLGTKQASDETSDEPPQNAASGSSHEASSGPSKEASSEPSKEASSQPSQEASPTASEKASPKPKSEPSAPTPRERSRRQAKAEREAAKKSRRSARPRQRTEPAADGATPKGKPKDAAKPSRRPATDKLPAERRSVGAKAKSSGKGLTEKPKPKPKPKGSERKRSKAGGTERRGDRRPLFERAGGAARAAWTSPGATKARERGSKGSQVVLAWLLAGLKSLLAGLKVIGALALGGLAELGRFWIRTAEILGGGILWIWRTVRPRALAALRLARRALAYAERAVTPKRAVAVVVIATAVVLAISQFVDYRGVKIGAPAYAGVEPVAPAPQTDRATTGSVHGYAMVPVAVIVIAAVILALRGRWKLARVIPLLGLLAIAVSLLLDARKGLEEGEAGIAYQGATAVLIEGFWLQLVSAAILVVAGLLLTRYSRGQEAPARRRGAAKRDGSERRRLRIAGVRT